MCTHTQYVFTVYRCIYIYIYIYIYTYLPLSQSHAPSPSAPRTALVHRRRRWPNAVRAASPPHPPGMVPGTTAAAVFVMRCAFSI